MIIIMIIIVIIIIIIGTVIFTRLSPANVPLLTVLTDYIIPAEATYIFFCMIGCNTFDNKRKSEMTCSTGFLTAAFLL